MNEKPEFPDEREQQRQRAFMDAMMAERRDVIEGSRADVNELNRRNRELLEQNIKLHKEILALRRRVRT